jgi:hypothetical protein
MTGKEPRDFLPLHRNWFHIVLCLVGAGQHGYGIVPEVLERTSRLQSTARLRRKRSAISRQLFSLRLLAFGCWLCGLTPGGARRIVAACEDFDV